MTDTIPHADVEGVPLLAVERLTTLRQTIAHHGERPAGAPPGDCYRTALACLLGLDDPTLVPHFAHLADGTEQPGWEMTRLTRHWLLEHHGCDLATIARAEAAELGVPYIATVHSQLGPWKHAVIGQGDEIVHDPSGLGTYTFAAHGLDPGDSDVAEALAVPYRPDPDELVARWRTDFAAEQA